MISIAVVILNYNGEKLLRQFLPSVIQYSTGATVCVADNGSTDGSIRLLQELFPQVTTLALEKNFGFCGGYNNALRQIDAEYFMILNSDVEVTENWLEPLRFLLDTKPAVAAVQPKILSYRSKQLFEYAGAGGGFIDSLGYPYCRGRIFDHLEKDAGQYDDECPVFWTSGACMMIRSKVFHEHGGFDEDLFAHMEEIDLCWKINRSGSSLYYTGKSCVYHLGAGTLGYQSPQKTYLNFRNGLSLIYKHLGGFELIYKFPLRVLLDWLAAVFFLLRGEGRNSLSVFRAHADFFRAWGMLRRKRRRIQQMHPSYPKTFVYRGLIIFDYYFRGRKTYTLNNPR